MGSVENHLNLDLYGPFNTNFCSLSSSRPTLARDTTTRENSVSPREDEEVTAISHHEQHHDTKEQARLLPRLVVVVEHES
eukprot:scaffold4600_cov169-Amphora_coffeaeformis.AAC.15